MSQEITIFISSRFGEFEELRNKIAKEKFSKLDINIKLNMLDYRDGIADARSPALASIEEASSSDIFILLLGETYKDNLADNDLEKSFTHQEYDSAIANQLDILAFPIGDCYCSKNIQLSTNPTFKAFQQTILKSANHITAPAISKDTSIDKIYEKIYKTLKEHLSRVISIHYNEKKKKKYKIITPLVVGVLVVTFNQEYYKIFLKTTEKHDETLNLNSKTINTLVTQIEKKDHKIEQQDKEIEELKRELEKYKNNPKVISQADIIKSISGVKEALAYVRSSNKELYYANFENKLNGIDFNKWLAKNINNISVLFDTTEDKIVIASAVIRKGTDTDIIKGEMILKASDEYLVIQNSWAGLPITLKVLDTNSVEVYQDINENEDETLFIISRKILKDGYRIVVSNGRNSKLLDIELKIK